MIGVRDSGKQECDKGGYKVRAFPQIPPRKGLAQGKYDLVYYYSKSPTESVHTTNICTSYPAAMADD